ncbi:hypothetical protein EJ04DRAFT_294907 [Polyplosphaeria fusca]|uniref:Rhodopsin domain-containing protein n=1 Tax=Polyplosphaeria fusca TaxID=682080 RepID=A0A9P4R9Q5_9PLEO|nr:hypothetical protein EJ04DRAFT_294907 [Polyplosphaeria fusca]
MSTGQRGRGAIEISGVFTGLAFITVLLRLYTRLCLLRYFGVEDCLVTLAMLCSIGLTVCIGVQVKYGMGKHIYEINPAEVPSSLKAFWASLIVYYLSLGLTKTSILLQYRRVFATKHFRVACWCVLAVVIAYTGWTVGSSILACVPVQAFWTHEPARCINQFAMWFTNAGINIATDFAIIILPMPVIRSLNLARRQKQALIAIFAIGGLVCVVSILRLQSLVAISNSKDQTYDNPPAATWSSVETNIGIICSCLPCLRPLVARVLPNVFSTTHKYGPNSVRPYNRSGYGRQSEGPATQLDAMDSKYSRDSSEADRRGDRIQVTTEVHVKVEDKDGRDAGNPSTEKEVGMERGSSTESLVRDVALAV